MQNHKIVIFRSSYAGMGCAFDGLEESLNAIPSDESEHELLNRGLTHYVNGNYESALAIFSMFPDAAQNDNLLGTYVEICSRCTKLGIHAEDLSVHARVSLHLALLPIHDKFATISTAPSWVKVAIRSLLVKFFGNGVSHTRCKYCSRYSEYVDPGKPTHGMSMSTEYPPGHNLCRYCKRSYPMPSIHWDSFTREDVYVFPPLCRRANLLPRV